MATGKKTKIEPLQLTDTPLSFRLNVITKKYYGAVLRHFENLDLERNFFILNVISKNEHITQQALANCIHVDKATVVRIIDYLSGKGLVKREPNPEDRREHRIIATKKALAYVSKISEGFSHLNKTAFKGFTNKEKEEFFGMMDRIQQNLCELPSETLRVKFIKSKK